MPNQALKRAIEIAGSQYDLATAIGAYQSKISFWLTTSRYGAPGEFCIPIENATGISRHELRPDIFGPPPHKSCTDREEAA